MNVKKYLIASLVVGVVANAWDYVLHGVVLKGQYAALPSLFRTDTNPAFPVLGDFVWAFVFVWVYDRVYASFGGGWKGGATWGLYAGILISFPAQLFMNLIFVGFPYSLAWIWTITGIVAGVVAGAVAGGLYRK